MKRAEILFAPAAKEFYVTERLRTFAFDSKTAVRILYIVGRCDYIVRNFKKILGIATVWAGEKVCNFWL